MLRAPGAAGSLLIALGFFLLSTGILTMRHEVLPYREGQTLRTAIHARVDFGYFDQGKHEKEQAAARESVLPIYSPTQIWKDLEEELVALPDKFAGRSLEDLPNAVKEMFHVERDGFSSQLDAAEVAAIEQAGKEPAWRTKVHSFILNLTRRPGTLPQERIILARKPVWTEGPRQGDPLKRVMVKQFDGPADTEVTSANILPVDDNLLQEIRAAAKSFYPQFQSLQPAVCAYVVNKIGPTHVPDEEATVAARNAAAAGVPSEKGIVSYSKGQIIKPEGRIGAADLVALRAEHETFIRSLSGQKLWRLRLGTAGIALMVAAALAAYIAITQPRIVHNHARGGALAGLLLATLLLATLAGMSGSGLYFFGTAPTLLVAMILAITYDRRFALGVALMHAILVTAALNQDISFFLMLFAGALTGSLMLNEVRTRSKLIEVGGVVAFVMFAASMISGANAMDPIAPLNIILRDSLYAAAAGLGVGFVVLGILPFIEKAFRITTSISLLELADGSKELLRRLAVEAPGTYNHSLQVATLAEAAAVAVGANSLLCRVGSYYHDIGKINKAEYFIENQIDGVNRHINLTPNVSLLIIIGHVKDGVEMAKEAGLPTALIPFIQQHHGTTLVEYFFHQAREQQESRPDAVDVPEAQYRYPGPKPRSRETAIVMIADAVESAARAITADLSPARVETLVHDMIQKRLLDGQFDECDMSLRDLHRIESHLIRALQGIYHGRIAYPGQAAATPDADSPPAQQSAARIA